MILPELSQVSTGVTDSSQDVIVDQCTKVDGEKGGEASNTVVDDVEVVLLDLPTVHEVIVVAWGGVLVKTREVEMFKKCQLEKTVKNCLMSVGKRMVRNIFSWY